MGRGRLTVLTGATSAAVAPVAVPLQGFVDLHTHPMANLAFGGKLIYGGLDFDPAGNSSMLPADPDCNQTRWYDNPQKILRATSVQQALGHDNSTHGAPTWVIPGVSCSYNCCGDDIRAPVIHTLQQANHAADWSNDDHLGYPDFSQWPVWNDITHQKMWVDWIRRAYNGGLRVLVALAVNNKTLGDLTRGPGDLPDDDQQSADLQIDEIKKFVVRHSEFMEVALTSADLYRIVSGGRLAVVIGVEIDNIGNLGTGAWTPLGPVTSAVDPQGQRLIAEIDRLYGKGVRYIFPIHLVDNPIGGTAIYEDIFDVAN